MAKARKDQKLTERNVVVGVRLTPKERDDWADDAEQVQRPLSGWIRHMVELARKAG